MNGCVLRSCVISRNHSQCPLEVACCISRSRGPRIINQYKFHAAPIPLSLRGAKSYKVESYNAPDGWVVLEKMVSPQDLCCSLSLSLRISICLLLRRPNFTAPRTPCENANAPYRYAPPDPRPICSRIYRFLGVSPSDLDGLGFK